MRIFILEDEIDRWPRNQIQDVLANRHSLVIARNMVEAKKAYEPPFDLLLLDHDLGGDIASATGYDFVKWLVFQHPQDNPPNVILHSGNPVGRENIRKFLEGFDYTVAEVPFSPKYIEILSKI